VVGSEINRGILRSLSRAERPEQGLLFGELVEAIGPELPTGRATTTSLYRHLIELEDAGVVLGNLPREQRRGRSVQYRIVASRLEEIYARSLAYALGETARDDVSP
jgi:DNA-binding transcriptional ArsR family regulator